MRTGLREIWAHKFRSLLTMLGIILGVSSLVAMSALVAGMEKGTKEALIAGVLQQRVTDEPATASRAAEYIARRLDALTDETERGWTGLFSADGFRFERVVRGVKEVAIIDQALLDSPDARLDMELRVDLGLRAGGGGLEGEHGDLREEAPILPRVSGASAGRACPCPARVPG